MQGKKMKKAAIIMGLVALVSTLTGCSNILTYVRHDESKGNIQCSNDKALKHDSACNATTR
jgi:hypothetical protein